MCFKFLFKKTKASRFLGFRQALKGDTISPAAENTRSDGADVAGILSNEWAT